MTASPTDARPITVPLADACGRYVDHFAYDRKAGG